MLFERKPLNDILADTPELLVNGDWQCLNIETGTAWPTKPQSFEFEGQTVWIMPHSTDNYPGLAINRPANLTSDDTWALLHRALSLLAWTEDTGAIVAHLSGGNLPRMMGLNKTGGVAIRDGFDLSDLPQTENERGKLALALMREGRGLNHPAYAFLSFFRVLEVAIPHGPSRGQWMTESLSKLAGRAKEALAELQETVPGDVGEHLRDSGRHAIAHARADPIINPDDPRDARRLQSELPIVQGLAVLAIEEKFGILTSHTIWKEHLYELRGWKPVFGEELVAAVLAGQPAPEDQNFDAPVLNVRLLRSSPFEPLEGMHPLQAAFHQRKIEVVYRSTDGLVDLIFWLNFETERLEFDIERSVVVRDDGSVGAAKNAKAMARFFRDYFLNGALQMWDAETGELVSRCDAFIPLNCYLDIDVANAGIAKWDETIAVREAAG